MLMQSAHIPSNPMTVCIRSPSQVPVISESPGVRWNTNEHLEQKSEIAHLGMPVHDFAPLPSARLHVKES